MTVPKSIPRSRKISERMCDFQGSPNNSSATSSYGEHTGQMAQSLSRVFASLWRPILFQILVVDTGRYGTEGISKKYLQARYTTPIMFVYLATVCKFFRSGRCTNGDACPFLHGSPQVQQQDGLCKFHLKGTCKFGAKCANKHILSGTDLLIDRYPLIL